MCHGRYFWCLAALIFSIVGFRLTRNPGASFTSPSSDKRACSLVVDYVAT
jgi:hypothetical protein